MGCWVSSIGTNISTQIWDVGFQNLKFSEQTIVKGGCYDHMRQNSDAQCRE